MIAAHHHAMIPGQHDDRAARARHRHGAVAAAAVSGRHCPGRPAGPGHHARRVGFKPEHGFTGTGKFTGNVTVRRRSESQLLLTLK
jgi:hypothetical protein